MARSFVHRESGLERIRQVVKWLLAIEHLEAEAPAPRTASRGAAWLASMLFRLEPLPSEPRPVVVKPALPFLGWLLAIEPLESAVPLPRAPSRDAAWLGSMLFRLEPLPSDPMPVVKPKRPLLGWLLAIEHLESRVPPPRAPSQVGPGLIFHFEPLPRDPVPVAKPKRPFLKWLLWPEAIPPGSREKTIHGGD